MKTYFGNTDHIHYLANGDFIPPYSTYNEVVIKRNQFVLNSDRVVIKPDALITLYRSLDESVCKTSFKDKDYLHNKTKIVTDWDKEIRNIPFAILESIIGRMSIMMELEGWQRDLVEKLEEKKETKMIYLFKANNIDNIWVITDNPTTELILEYSKIYMDFLDENKSVVCDFLVFGKNEVDTASLPSLTKTIVCGE